MIDCCEIANESRHIALVHGWSDPPETDAEHIVNVICDLMDAWQLYRDGHDPDEPITCEGAGCQMRKVCSSQCDQYKPQAIAVELADAVLRILSSATAFTLRCAAWRIVFQSKRDAVNLDDMLLYCLSQTMLDRKTADSMIVSEIILWCNANDVPLEEAIRQKMEYNRKRPYRHGGKRA